MKTKPTRKLLDKHVRQFDRVFARVVAALEAERAVSDEYVQKEAAPEDDGAALSRNAEIASGDVTIHVEVRVRRH